MRAGDRRRHRHRGLGAVHRHPERSLIAGELAARIAARGHAGRLTGDDLSWVRAATHDGSPTVRAVAVAALVRAAPVRVAVPAWHDAADDPAPAVRRRAAELAPDLMARRRAVDPDLEAALVTLLRDGEVTVVEAAAWALGEQGAAAAPETVGALGVVVGGHADALAREAAVAALGAIGDPAGLDAILAACTDKPAVRRRAVLALAPFEGAAVDAAIVAALDDRDWQVRQAAEDLRDAGSADADEPAPGPTPGPTPEPPDGGISATSGP